jgi:uncharacterized protein (TIGR02118 family)
MIKILAMIKRKEGTSLEDYRKWATVDHPKLARNIPSMIKYTVNVVIKDDPSNPFDSISEMWFDSEETAAAAFASDGGKAAGADAAAHASNRVRLMTHETLPFGH